MREISVIIPAYNGGDRLEMALERLARQRDIDLAEVIVVNDGSTDGTKDYLDGLHHPWLRVIHQENAGRSQARNTGLAAAESEIVVFLDADIVVCDDFLRLYLEAQQKRPGVYMGEIFNLRNYEMEEIRRCVQGEVDGLKAMSEEDSLYNLCRLYHRWSGTDEIAWVCTTGANISVPRDKAREIGGFDTGFDGWGPEDVEFAFRLAQAGVPLYSLGAAYCFHLDKRNNDHLDMESVVKNLRYFYKKHKHPEIRAYMAYATGDLSIEELYGLTMGREVPESRTYFRALSYLRRKPTHQ
jgi:glycosyltransferase involved in cell wall biosynthesis